MTSSPQSRLFSNEAETALVVEKLATLSYTEAFARGLVDALTDSFNVTTMQAFGAPTAQAALESLKNTSKTPPRILSSLASHMLAHELAVSNRLYEVCSHDKIFLGRHLQPPKGTSLRHSIARAL